MFGRKTCVCAVFEILYYYLSNFAFRKDGVIYFLFSQPSKIEKCVCFVLMQFH